MTDSAGARAHLGSRTRLAPVDGAVRKFDFEWTDGLGEKFDRAGNDAGITYMGNFVQFQNGFGAWSIMNYECQPLRTLQSVRSVALEPPPPRHPSTWGKACGKNKRQA